MKHYVGFTLIELLIVVVVIGVLAAIAYPSYLDNVRKTRRADGKGLLLDQAHMLERCYALYNAYNDTNCPALRASSDEGYYILSTTGPFTASQFTLIATPTGKHSDDNATTGRRCGYLTYNNLGVKGARGPLSAAECW